MARRQFIPLTKSPLFAMSYMTVVGSMGEMYRGWKKDGVRCGMDVTWRKLRRSKPNLVPNSF